MFLCQRALNTKKKNTFSFSDSRETIQTDFELEIVIPIKTSKLSFFSPFRHPFWLYTIPP